MTLGLQLPGPYPFKLLESSVPQKCSQAVEVPLEKVLRCGNSEGWKTDNDFTCILPLPGAFMFLKGQDLHSLTLRNESIGRDTSFLWIELEHIHMAPLKSHHTMHNSPHFLVIQTTLPSPTNGSPLELDDEWWRSGVWSVLQNKSQKSY